MDPIARDRDGLDRVLARLAFVEVESTEDFVDRVLAALDDDGGARLSILRPVLRLPSSAWQMVRRRAAGAAAHLAERDRLRRGAVASSVVLLGVLAIGLEARHLYRLREERAL